MATTLASKRLLWPIVRCSFKPTLLLCTPFKNRRIAAALFILSATFGAQPAHAQSDAPGEYQLKAAFLYNFAKFIQWPQTAFSSPQSAFHICILGDDPFGKSIDDLLRGKFIGDHPVAILRCRGITEIAHCHILFVSSSEAKKLPEILASLKDDSTLIVGETDGFAESGGAIQFTLENQRVRFLINVDAVSHAGLQVSSKLLALAKIIREAPADRKT